MANTPWGYSVGTLPPLLTVAQFRALCPDFSATDAQIQATLEAASAAIRDYCGWHVSPSLECSYVGNGDGRLLMLPAMGVSSVDSLTVSGYVVPTNAYEWTGAGMVRLRSGMFPKEWRSVECEYTAGFDSAAVVQVAVQVASNALAAAPGVSSERAGNVSITYNQTGSGITGGVSLLSRDMESLAPYRLSRAW